MSSSRAPLGAYRLFGSRLLALRRPHFPRRGFRSCHTQSRWTLNDGNESRITGSRSRTERHIIPETEASKYLGDAMVHYRHEGQHVLIDAIYLRDLCQCSLCRDPSTGQKLFQTADIPLDIQAIVKEDDNNLSISWDNDISGYFESHRTLIRKKDLDPKSISYVDDEAGRQTWDRDTLIKNLEWFNYEELFRSEATLCRAIRQLARFGVMFLMNVTQSETAIEDLGKQLGGLRHTFYGWTWDVKSAPDAKNIAYTDKPLGPHMDLLYMTDPPHLQVLHSLEADAPGGASVFSDGLNAATKLFVESYKDFEVLTKYGIRYEYHHGTDRYECKRPTISTLNNPFGRTDPQSFVGPLAYSPPFQANRRVAARGHDAAGYFFLQYLQAIKRFAGFIEDPGDQDGKGGAAFEHRLAPGEAVVFDNRRILHWRTAFDAKAGARWLKGAYIDGDGFHARCRALGLSSRLASHT